MDMIVWVLIIFNGILLLALLTFGFLFTVRKRTTLHVIMPDKTLVSKSRYGALEKVQSVGDGTYFIDDECIVRGFWGFKLYYFYGNPNPIRFDFNKNMPHEIGTKAQEIKSFHESDLVKKLFATESLENIIMYLVIGVGILTLAVLIIVLTKGTPQVTLANNANNTQLIANAVRIAIRGG